MFFVFPIFEIETSSNSRVDNRYHSGWLVSSEVRYSRILKWKYYVVYYNFPICNGQGDGQIRIMSYFNSRIVLANSLLTIAMSCWESKGAPPNAPAPRNKALLRDYQGIMVVNNPSPGRLGGWGGWAPYNSQWCSFTVLPLQLGDDIHCLKRTYLKP